MRKRITCWTRFIWFTNKGKAVQSGFSYCIFMKKMIQYNHTIKGGFFVIWQEKTGMLKYTRKN